MSAAYAVAAGLHLFSVGLVVGFMAITLWALIPAQHLLDGAQVHLCLAAAGATK